MAFTSVQLVDIRRFCGYPAYGGTPASFQSYRFFQAYGALEYRLANLSSDEQTVVVNTYLTNLYLLETDIVGSTGVRGNLDTDVAAVWTHNKDEYKDRKRLFDGTRRELCAFLGVTPGPGLSNGGMAILV